MTEPMPVQRRRAALARRRAVEYTEHERALLVASERTHAPWPPLGSMLLVALGVWLFVGVWPLGYQLTLLAQDSSLRETGAAVVVTLAGLWLHRVGRDRIASGLAVTCGALLVLSGAFLPHGSAKTTMNEILMGLLVMVCGASLFRVRGQDADYN